MNRILETSLDIVNDYANKLHSLRSRWKKPKRGIISTLFNLRRGKKQLEAFEKIRDRFENSLPWRVLFLGNEENFTRYAEKLANARINVVRYGDLIKVSDVIAIYRKDKDKLLYDNRENVVSYVHVVSEDHLDSWSWMWLNNGLNFKAGLIHEINHFLLEEHCLQNPRIIHIERP